ncbi:major facilitator superfamily domain-containing protein [Aspergillus minisclerotigenes]|uniref:Major facilitator superfamily domain-containing protein n=1 Tax=Aspergillus minisclerotigenes TaxID=656917 RepID=A0A5N6JG80_9EURO|nr:major facilitator superfamily domain-containing protein [Aspergillus minisclerotigenes]
MLSPSSSPERPFELHSKTFEQEQPPERSRPGRTRRQQMIVVLSCFTLTFTGCGLNFAFGVYQELYEASDGPFKNASPGDINLIGTLAASLMTLGAPIAGKLSNAYGPRAVVLLGGILLATSGVAASFGTQLWHFQVTQGVIQGCAACLIYIPAVTLSPGYFDERRAFAMGIITSGTGFGGMAWAPFIRLLISLSGYRQAILVAGMIAGTMVAICALALEMVKDVPMKQPQARDRYHLRDGGMAAKSTKGLVFSQDFISHSLGTFLQAAAYMIPVYFMSSYARTLGYSRTAGANIIALSDACNSGGKILIGYYADWLGRLNALALSTFVSAAATFGLCYISTSHMSSHLHQALFIIYACGYGMAAGAYVSLFPAALVEQFGTLNFIRVSGPLYMIRGLGTLVGTPLGGALVRHDLHWEGAAASSSFDRTFLFVGFLLFGATACVSWARYLM